ncbi:MAG: hypothetical protein FD145_1318 [Candidatus Saganbacteria bacterium]|uniref:Outer membrane lipoprotein carrier protein LolA n=1 Tax=Candidatus Saganbacteria bacterium TaxID=2575572 RepID=A0A833L046_UNCSA|nr:MAG: hypothetical protein FD145_1318 [Candidatus Saganbacteria bacterium]
MVKRIVSVFMALSFVFAVSVLASDLSIDELIKNIQSNQSQIKDMSADMATKMSSNMKGAKDIEQKGKITIKYPNKTKMEMFEPSRQVTINNGKKMIMIDKNSGQRYEQDLSKTNMPMNNADNMDFQKAKEYFNFSVKKEGDKYLITGKTKKENKLIGKMEILINPDKWLPEKIKAYNPQNKLISETDMEYEKISNCWVMVKSKSSVTMPNGSMKMDMEYKNVKINKGIGDGEFDG